MRRPHSGVEPAVRRYAELQPIFAGVFHVIGAGGTMASTTELVMTAVVAMPATLGVSTRHEVAQWDFVRFLFAHITFLQ
jgi:hypothetical protein